MENAASNNLPDEDWEDMHQPVQNTAAQLEGQLQDLGYVDVGYYDISNGLPPLHEYRDPTINNYAGDALDLPVQAQAVPLDPVCANLTFLHMYI
jgi:hypothetical protein